VFSDNCQYAAIEALRNSDDDVEAMVREYNRRRRIMVEGFRSAGLNVLSRWVLFMFFRA